nr:sugar transferase [Clostridia bacterium]
MHTETNLNTGAERTNRYLQYKRLQDIILSIAALIILFPAMLIISIVILVDSPGQSPIFVQERVGMNGRKFRFFKFRTMHPDAEKHLEELLVRNEMSGPVFKIKDDPRITRVGKILRRTSLDELPQLWNVLKGDMSIVGPRPALPREVEQYDEEAWKRTAVLPGLTCYWQIQPKRNSLPFTEWLALDLKYIEERSFLVDWKIMLQTIGAVLHMEGE